MLLLLQACRRTDLGIRRQAMVGSPAPALATILFAAFFLQSPQSSAVVLHRCRRPRPSSLLRLLVK